MSISSDDESYNSDLPAPLDEEAGSDHTFEDEDSTDNETYSESEDSDSDDDTDGADNENDPDSYSTGDATVLPSNVLRLEKIASINITIALWNHATATLPELRTHTLEGRKSLFDQVREWSTQLLLPKLFAKQIRDNFKDVVLNVRKWISYHFREIMLGRGTESDLHRFVGCIVWYPNGAIHQHRTALNLLQSIELGDVEKYRVACTYCMEDEVRNRWPAMFETNSLDTLEFHRQPLIYYWNQCCSCESNLVPPYNDHTSVDEYMIRKIHPDKSNWPAIEYFFNRLNDEEQVASASYYADSRNAQCQRLILIKMNELQRMHVYANKAVRIIRNHVDAGGADINEPNAILVWYEACDLITQDQFVSLMKRLCKVATSDNVMMEIWLGAYDEMKRYLLSVKNYDYVGHLIRWYSQRKVEGLDYLFDVLVDRAKMGKKPRTSEQNKFSIKLCERLISSDDLESVIRLLKFCIPDAIQCAQFKLKIPDKSAAFDKYCKTLITENEFARFEQLLAFFHTESLPASEPFVLNLLRKNLKYVEDRFLHFYSTENLKELNEELAPLIKSYPDVILEFKREVLFSKRGLETCADLLSSTTNILSEIVKDCLSDDKLLSKFGAEMILSNRGVRKLHHLIHDQNFSNVVVKRNVNLFLKSNKDKRKLKFKLLFCITAKELRADRNAKKKYVTLLWSLF